MQKLLRVRVYETLVSAFVVVVLVGQVVALTPTSFGWGGRMTWPFLSYHMYTRTYQENDVVEAYHLMEATLADGQVIDITQETLGLSVWDYRLLTAGLLRDDPAALKLFGTRHKYAIAELRIKTFPVMVTRAGPQERTPEVVKRIAFDVLPADSSVAGAPR